MSLVRPRVYLAGPEVFLPDAAAIGSAKRAICDRYGLVGHFPLDGEASVSAAIFAACLGGLRGCAAVIANLTPFRGVSADPGTAVELGYALALGRPVFGYTNRPGELRARVVPDGLAIEDFGLFDNLMLAEALAETGGVVMPSGSTNDPLRALDGFEICAARAARQLGVRSSPETR